MKNMQRRKKIWMWRKELLSLTSNVVKFNSAFTWQAVVVWFILRLAQISCNSNSEVWTPRSQWGRWWRPPGPRWALPPARAPRAQKKASLVSGDSELCLVWCWSNYFQTRPVWSRPEHPGECLKGAGVRPPEGPHWAAGAAHHGRELC